MSFLKKEGTINMLMHKIDISWRQFFEILCLGKVTFAYVKVVKVSFINNGVPLNTITMKILSCKLFVDWNAFNFVMSQSLT